MQTLVILLHRVINPFSQKLNMKCLSDPKDQYKCFPLIRTYNPSDQVTGNSSVRNITISIQCTVSFVDVWKNNHFVTKYNFIGEHDSIFFVTSITLELLSFLSPLLLSLSCLFLYPPLPASNIPLCSYITFYLSTIYLIYT